MGEEVYLKVQIQKPRPEHVRTLTATPMTVKASQAGKEEVKLTASFEAGYCLDYFTVTEREGSAKKIEGNSFRFEKSVVVGVVAKRSAKAEVDRLFKDYENKARDELKKYESTVSKSKRDEIEQYAKSIKKKLIFNGTVFSPSAKGVSSKFSISSLGISGISIQFKGLEASVSGAVSTLFRSIRQAAIKVKKPDAVWSGVVARLTTKVNNKISILTNEHKNIRINVANTAIHTLANRLLGRNG